MLGPLLVAAIEQTGAFSAVVLTPGAAGGDLRLDTEIVRLQHEFQTSPSRVRFTLRAYLVDDKTRRVLAWRQFEAAADAASNFRFSAPRLWSARPWRSETQRSFHRFLVFSRWTWLMTSLHPVMTQSRRVGRRS